MTEKLKTVTASRDELNREINERKKAEKALQFTRFCIDHANEMLYWVDPEGKIVDVNDTSCNKLGYSREELVSMGVEDIDPYTPIKEYDQIWQDLKKHRTSKAETVHYAKTGESIPVEMTFNHITFDGKEYNCVFAHDISARKQAEEELQKSMSELAERVKELNCLFEISRLVEKRKLTLDEILQGIVDLIPSAWQYPDITCAKIESKWERIENP